MVGSGKQAGNFRSVNVTVRASFSTARSAPENMEQQLHFTLHAHLLAYSLVYLIVYLIVYLRVYLRVYRRVYLIVYRRVYFIVYLRVSLHVYLYVHLPNGRTYRHTKHEDIGSCGQVHTTLDCDGMYPGYRAQLVTHTKTTQLTSDPTDIAWGHRVGHDVHHLLPDVQDGQVVLSYPDLNR